MTFHIDRKYKFGSWIFCSAITRAVCCIKVLPNLFSPDNPHKSPTLKDVFIFLTGCSKVPPLGFQEAVPRISFSDTDSLPRVSTCALTFMLPYSLPTDLEAFKEKMTFAILNLQGFFGQVWTGNTYTLLHELACNIASYCTSGRGIFTSRRRVKMQPTSAITAICTLTSVIKYLLSITTTASCLFSPSPE